jgi:hypothetical protein
MSGTGLLWDGGGIQCYGIGTWLPCDDYAIGSHFRVIAVWLDPTSIRAKRASLERVAGERGVERQGFAEEREGFVVEREREREGFAERAAAGDAAAPTQHCLPCHASLACRGAVVALPPTRLPLACAAMPPLPLPVLTLGSSPYIAA